MRPFKERLVIIKMKRKRFFSLEFGTLFLLFIGYIFYLCLHNILPGDFFISMDTFKKDSEYVFQKDLSRIMICSKSLYNSDYQNYYHNPDALFNNTEYLFPSKYKNKQVAVVKLDGNYFIAQKFRPYNIWSFLSIFLCRTSFAYRAWYYGHFLNKNQIPAAKPLMFIEKKFGPFCLSSYLITSYIPGIKGEEYFATDSAFSEHWPETSASLLKTIQQLEKLKIFHPDFSIENCIIKDETPYLIDLEKMHRAMNSKNLSKQYISSMKKNLSNTSKNAHQVFFEQTLQNQSLQN